MKIAGIDENGNPISRADADKRRVADAKSRPMLFGMRQCEPCDGCGCVCRHCGQAESKHRPSLCPERAFKFKTCPACKGQGIDPTTDVGLHPDYPQNIYPEMQPHRLSEVIEVSGDERRAR